MSKINKSIEFLEKSYSFIKETDTAGKEEYYDETGITEDDLLVAASQINEFSYINLDNGIPSVLHIETILDNSEFLLEALKVLENKDNETKEECRDAKKKVEYCLRNFRRFKKLLKGEINKSQETLELVNKLIDIAKENNG